MLIEFFVWWYGSGWQEVATKGLELIKRIEMSFSIPVLFKTLFAPWKRIVTYPGRSLDEKLRSLLDNFISRAVGFFVRLLSLIATLILTVLAAAISLSITVLWPLIPILIVYCVVRGVIG